MQDVLKIAYMVDQSHNLKPKIEAMIQTVMTAQEMFAKACLVDRESLRRRANEVGHGWGGGNCPSGFLH